MARYIANHSREALWSIGADLIYDYFSGLFKKEIMNVDIVWGLCYNINENLKGKIVVRR